MAVKYRSVIVLAAIVTYECFVVKMAVESRSQMSLRREITIFQGGCGFRLSEAGRKSI